MQTRLLTSTITLFELHRKALVLQATGRDILVKLNKKKRGIAVNELDPLRVKRGMQV